jgi:hypothetical protein
LIASEEKRMPQTPAQPDTNETQHQAEGGLIDENEFPIHRFKFFRRPD